MRRCGLMKSIPVRKTSLHAPGDGGTLKDKTPQQLLGMMWQLALNAWAFKDIALPSICNSYLIAL